MLCQKELFLNQVRYNDLRNKKILWKNKIEKIQDLLLSGLRRENEKIKFSWESVSNNKMIMNKVLIEERKKIRTGIRWQQTVASLMR